MRQESIMLVVTGIDPANAAYIVKRQEVADEFWLAGKFLKEGKKRLAAYAFITAKKRAAQFREWYLTPANIRVGDGVTVNLWSDRYAATVIKVTKSTVTVRRDKGTLDPNFKPEWIPGGFAGHCINQDEQKYSYAPDENGAVYTFRWSNKYQRYGQPGNMTLSKGRHEFYDYNF